MGFHVCDYCAHGAQNRFSNMSSGDVTLIFDSGRAWQMPDMILHYVADHEWQSPTEFVDDVMNHRLTGGERLQTKGFVQPTRIAYLTGPYTKGPVPNGFVEKLQALVDQAARSGNRVQYRGA